MTVLSTDRIAGPFIGDGVQQSFPFGIHCFDAEDLVVEVTTPAGARSVLDLGADYTVTLNSDQALGPGGTVHATAPVAAGSALRITTDTAVTQRTSITSAGGFFPRVIERALDKLTILVQQILASRGRELRVPEIAGVAELPDAATRANGWFKFDAAGGLGVYHGNPTDASGLASDLANASASKGAALVAYLGSGAGAAARNVRDVLRERGIFLTDFAGAVADGTTDNSLMLSRARAVAAAVRSRVVIPAASSPWFFSSQIDQSDTFVSIVGQSQEKSVIKCAQGIKLRNTATDGGDTCELIENVTILGTYAAGSIGLDKRFASRSTTRRVIVQGFETGVKSIDSFVELYDQVEVKDCKYNWHLAGSNHATKLSACGSVGAGNSWGGVGTSLLIGNAGADSLQSCLSFDTCDFEFGAGDGADITATGTVTFHNCYMEALSGTNFIVRSGDVVVEGGGEYIIKDSSGYLVDPKGGRIVFRDRAGITSDGSTRLYASLIKAGGSGSVVFESTTLYGRFLTTNQGVLPPLIGHGIVGVPFIKPQGRAFGMTAFSGAASQTTTGDTYRVTCTTAGAIGVYQQMTSQPRIGRSCLMLIRYRSNAAFSVTVCAAAGQSSPTTIGTIQSSAGALQVHCIPTAGITLATQSWVEFWRAAGWAVNDYLELEEVLFVDSGAVENGLLSF